MVFTCLQENLAKGLQMAKQSGAKYTSLPILQNFLLQNVDGTVSVTSTNLELSIKAYIRGKLDGNGTIALSQEKIFQYIKNLPQGKLNLELQESNLVIESDAGFQATFHGVDASDFPSLPTFIPKHSLVLSLQELKQSLKLASTSLPKNDFRPEIAGVYFSKKDQTLVLVGTDGFRLSEKKLQIPSLDEEDFSYIIPSKTVSELIRIFDLIDDEEVTVNFGENQMLVTSTSVEITSKLVEGSFPQYEGLIPSDFSRTFSLDKQELTQAIRLSSVFSADSVHDIKFVSKKQDSNLSIQSSHSDIGSNQAQIAYELSGESDFEITFNYAYILEGLSALKGDIITFHVNDSDSPTILKGNEDNWFFYLVMPIRE